MYNSAEIYKKAQKLIRSHGTNDPFRIAQESGIEVIYTDYFKDLLGMYLCKYKNRCIILNSNMDEHLTRMVMAHELGHDRLHREIAKKEGLKEFALFRMKDNTEYEANAFAAHILLDTNEVLNLCIDGYTVSEIAGLMNTEINLVLIKVQEMIRLGSNLTLPLDTRGDFLKNIKA